MDKKTFFFFSDLKIIFSCFLWSSVIVTLLRQRNVESRYWKSMKFDVFNLSQLQSYPLISILFYNGKTFGKTRHF